MRSPPFPLPICSALRPTWACRTSFPALRSQKPTTCSSLATKGSVLSLSPAFLIKLSGSALSVWVWLGPLLPPGKVGPGRDGVLDLLLQEATTALGEPGGVDAWARQQRQRQQHFTFIEGLPPRSSQPGLRPHMCWGWGGEGKEASNADMAQAKGVQSRHRQGLWEQGTGKPY